MENKKINFSTRYIENIHVGLWIVKDMFWMLEYKTLGCIMVVPTVIAAIYIVFSSQNKNEIWVNLAVLCWIIANASWMLVEFFQLKSKLYSLPFFVLGLFFFIIYIYKSYLYSRNG
jgi:uncharacterized membrane protein